MIPPDRLLAGGIFMPDFLCVAFVKLLDFMEFSVYNKLPDKSRK